MNSSVLESRNKENQDSVSMWWILYNGPRCIILKVPVEKEQPKRWLDETLLTTYGQIHDF